MPGRRVSPTGEVDCESVNLAAEEPGGPVYRLRQAQTSAGSAHCLGIPDLSLNLNDVGT
jgi:hypothetical protein